MAHLEKLWKDNCRKKKLLVEGMGNYRYVCWCRGSKKVEDQAI